MRHRGKGTGDGGSREESHGGEWVAPPAAPATANGSVTREPRSAKPAHAPLSDTVFFGLPEYPWAPFFLFLVTCALHFYRIDEPAAVVFDEYHFGALGDGVPAVGDDRPSAARPRGAGVRAAPPGPASALRTSAGGQRLTPRSCSWTRAAGRFTNQYNKGTYLFDIHPPMGKLTLYFTGVLFGYDADHCSYDSIHKPYDRKLCKFLPLRIMACAFRAPFARLRSLTRRRMGLPRALPLASSCAQPSSAASLCRCCTRSFAGWAGGWRRRCSAASCSCSTT